MTEPTAQPEAPQGEPKAKAGRPSLYSDEIANEIIDRLSKGEPLAHICRDEHIPASRTISDWKRSHPEFSANFAHARDDGFDAIALDTLEIADDASRDTKLVTRENGEVVEVCNAEWVSRSKLRIETRLKLLARWDPKRYGDKLAVGGIEDAPPIKTELTGNVTIDPALVLKAMRELDAET